MPIVVTVDRGPVDPIVTIDPDRRRLDFASLDGSQVFAFNDSTYVVGPEMQGMYMPPRRIATAEAAGLEGVRLQYVDTGPRSVILPMFVTAQDGQVESHLQVGARLRRFFDYRQTDYVSSEGTFDLVATQQDGSSKRYLRCLYEDGMEGARGTFHGTPGAWSLFDIKAIAVDPYWRGDQWSTPVLSLPTTNPFLRSATTNPSGPLRLTTTTALGSQFPVDIGGDVPSAAIIELVGPSTSTHVTSPSGLDVTIGSLSAGQTFLLDTGRNRRVVFNTTEGGTAWTKVGPSPQWRPLFPGSAAITIVMTGANSDSRAVVYGTEQWETAW